MSASSIHGARSPTSESPSFVAPCRRQANCGVARLERQAELSYKLDIGAHPVRDELAAPLGLTNVGQQFLLHAAAPAAGPLAGLEHDDIRARPRQVARGRQAGEAGADDDHVMHPAPNPCSGQMSHPPRSPG